MQPKLGGASQRTSCRATAGGGPAGCHPAAPSRLPAIFTPSASTGQLLRRPRGPAGARHTPLHLLAAHRGFGRTCAGAMSSAAELALKKKYALLQQKKRQVRAGACSHQRSQPAAPSPALRPVLESEARALHCAGGGGRRRQGRRRRRPRGCVPVKCRSSCSYFCLLPAACCWQLLLLIAACVCTHPRLTSACTHSPMFRRRCGRPSGRRRPRPRRGHQGPASQARGSSSQGRSAPASGRASCSAS